MHSWFIHSICLLYLYHIPPTPSVKPSKAYSRGSVVMVDEIMHASPSKFRFPEAGLRVMVTSHFGPKTRLRMASRLIITEVQLRVVAPIKGLAAPDVLSGYRFHFFLLISPAQYTSAFFIYHCRNIRNMAAVRVAACLLMCSLT